MVVPCSRYFPFGLQATLVPSEDKTVMFGSFTGAPDSQSYIVKDGEFALANAMYLPSGENATLLTVPGGNASGSSIFTGVPDSRSYIIMNGLDPVPQIRYLSSGEKPAPPALDEGLTAGSGILMGTPVLIS